MGLCQLLFLGLCWLNRKSQLGNGFEFRESWGRSVFVIDLVLLADDGCDIDSVGMCMRLGRHLLLNCYSRKVGIDFR